jgi:beta-glucosidase
MLRPHRLFVSLTLLSMCFCAFAANLSRSLPTESADKEQPLYKDKSAPVDDRIADLMPRMTLKEKIGQLLCPLGWPMYDKQTDGRHTRLQVSEEFKKRMTDMPIGSLWAVQRADPWTQKTLFTGINAEESADVMNMLQRYAIENTRLGIPILIMEEAPHGHMAIGSTCFPTGIGQAATFDYGLMKQMGKAIGTELSLRGAHVAYGPVLDIAREPRWSRVEETFGEDPYLAGVLGAGIVEGVRSQGVVNTLKHFAAYGIPEGGLNGEQVSLGWNQLLNEFIPQFRMAVDAGAGSIMTSYNAIDGVPCTGNKELLTGVLRREWGFGGFVISDLQSIEVMSSSLRVAQDYTHAAAMALKAGVDIDLQGNSYRRLEKALTKGLVSMSDIDRAVENVLRTKFQLGLFDNPYVDKKATKAVRCEQHRLLACRAAQESIVLLENNGVLPLDKNIKSIAVIGPNADNRYNQLGDYTAPQAEEDIVTVLEGIREKVPEAQVNYVKGCAVRDTARTDIQSAVAAAKRSDVTVLVVGGSSARDFKTSYASTGAAEVSSDTAELPDMECGEGYDRSTLGLMGDQLKLMQALIDAGVKLVTVYIEGRPLNMNLAAEHSDALLCAWYPGEQGGNAVADVLFGDYNPAGRMPVSVPRSVGQLPVYYSKRVSHDYIDSKASPLYPFGYGKSYTEFAYSDVRCEKTGEQEYTVSCTVTNTGKTAGDEVVQLYLNDEYSSVAIPRKQLKGFRRINLQPDESKTVEFKLGINELSIYDSQRRRVIEPGTFKVYVGGSSQYDAAKPDCSFTTE